MQILYYSSKINSSRVIQEYFEVNNINDVTSTHIIKALQVKTRGHITQMKAYT